MKSHTEVKNDTILTQNHLQSILDYNPNNGIFRWKVDLPRMCTKVGAIAGSIGSRYANIQINNKRYQIHRLAWLYVYGIFPPQMLDHINGNKLDNRISNLREATLSQNQFNTKINKLNTTGFKGVRRTNRKTPYTASIRINKKIVHLGVFNTPEEAHKAYCKAAKEIHGEFFNPG